jgi:hypothetical protein
LDQAVHYAIRPWTLSGRSVDSMTGANAKMAADFKAVWDQFKATREKEIIPAIHSGNLGDAQKIVDGIQADRLSKMWGIMSCKVR